MYIKMLNFSNNDFIFTSTESPQSYLNMNNLPSGIMYHCDVSTIFDSNNPEFHFVEKSRYNNNVGIINGGLYEYAFDYDKNYYVAIPNSSLVYSYMLTDIIGLPFSTKLLKFDLRVIEPVLLWDFIFAMKSL
ncbi:hypothetical protein RaK2_00487 [Klebsiella phage vB_KleM_RaK2]|uniref:Uncharacterized protein n=1 Tax=Klebsiella phage vB_KleM_RaK2 TaxID=1147094 RepID=H6X4U4_9CAUD|nr:hypothetical protein F403_gp048 [Klebsiella phage vB_KleM_RaK2]AFA44760.1 hypothetical protein RaK2_00487 [Klebsiella phage vB_KleM_RaK2]